MSDSTDPPRTDETDFDPLITLGMARRVFCVRGMKTWLEEREFDFRDFADNGIRASQLLAIGEEGLVESILIADANAARPEDGDTDGR